MVMARVTGDKKLTTNVPLPTETHERLRAHAQSRGMLLQATLARLVELYLTVPAEEQAIIMQQVSGEAAEMVARLVLRRAEQVPLPIAGESPTLSLTPPRSRIVPKSEAGVERRKRDQ